MISYSAIDEDPVSVLPQAVTLAANASCRYFLESFSKEFRDQHARQFRCHYKIDDCKDSTSALLRHFEDCVLVTADSDKLLGDDMSSKLSKRKIQLPSAGKLVDVFKSFCEKVHTDNLLRMGTGEVILSSTLSNVEKRLFIRFLMAKGHDVVIFDKNVFRPPKTQEITTPPKKTQPETTFPSSASSAKRCKISPDNKKIPKRRYSCFEIILYCFFYCRIFFYVDETTLSLWTYYFRPVLFINI